MTRHIWTVNIQPCFQEGALLMVTRGIASLVYINPRNPKKCIDSFIEICIHSCERSDTIWPRARCVWVNQFPKKKSIGLRHCRRFMTSWYGILSMTKLWLYHMTINNFFIKVMARKKTKKNLSIKQSIKSIPGIACFSSQGYDNEIIIWGRNYNAYTILLYTI